MTPKRISFLTDLPDELVGAICSFLSCESDLYRLALTSHRLQYFADPLLYRQNSSGESDRAALLSAARTNNESTVQKAIQYQVALNPTGTDKLTPLHIACLKGYTGVAAALLNAPEISTPIIEAQDSDRNTPLHWASKKGHIEVIRLLLKAGAKLEARNNSGSRPLHSAACGGSEATVLFLVEQGAELEARDCKRRTPLLVAVKCDPEAEDAAKVLGEGIVRLLLEKGADDKARDIEGSTLLHIAASSGNPYTVELLLARGADPGAIDCFGMTPLHMAFYGRSILAIRYLLDQGADLTIKDDHQMTPADYGEDLLASLQMDDKYRQCTEAA